MKDARAALGMALAALMAAPSGSALANTLAIRRITPEVPTAVLSPADSLVARGGGRGGGGAGGGQRSGSRANNGFSAAGAGFNRGSTRPSGGWSSQVGPGASPGPSLDRAYSNRNGNRNGNRSGNRSGTINVNRNVNRDVNRNWNRQVNINTVNVNPGWARPGWGVARPWAYGWYGGWSTPAWGWWGARAALWGVSTLTTAAIINNAVNGAIADNDNTIIVPNSNYSLYYGSVQPSGQSVVTFVVQADGSNYQLSADCNAGTMNGEEPKTAAQAELLNAACQVAFGST